MNKQESKQTFIIEQLEEALEERQKPDRRVANQGFNEHATEERRKLDRRAARQKH